MKLRLHKRKNTLKYINKPKVSFWQKFINFTSVLGGLKLLYDLSIEIIKFIKDFFK